MQFSGVAKISKFQWKQIKLLYTSTRYFNSSSNHCPRTKTCIRKKSIKTNTLMIGQNFERNDLFLDGLSSSILILFQNFIDWNCLNRWS